MIGIFINARLGSTRLPNKHLIKTEGRSFIEWLVSRFTYGFRREILNNEVKLYITTADQKENKIFEEVFENTYVEVFYGSSFNIPLRHLQCAKMHDIDYILSIDGDDILCSIEASRIVINEFKRQTIEIVKTSGLPLGMNVMGYSTDFLEKSLKKLTKERLETGWGRIFKNEHIKEITIDSRFDCSGIRMTLDYTADANFFKEIITNFGTNINEVSDDALLFEIIKNKWYRINQGLNEHYWDNFNDQIKSE